MIQLATKWLKRALTAIWLLAILLVSALVTLDNPEPTTLHLLGTQFSASAGFLFVASLCCGILLGISCVLPTLYLTRLRCQRASQREQQLKTQLEQQAPIKAS